MKYTLLELTQQVLSSIDGDEINSITDNVEAQQVVNLIKRCYGNLAAATGYPERYSLFGLSSSGDGNKPTIMTLPDTMLSIDWVKYDCRKVDETDTDFQLMSYVPLNEFFERMHALKPSADTSLQTFNQIVNGQTVQFIIQNNEAPSYYTTWDDRTLVFNSFDNAVELTLQTSKTLCYGEEAPTWTASDSFVIPLDDHQVLLNTVISWAWAEMKQSVNAKAEREVIKQLISTDRKKHAIDPVEDYIVQSPNYGRR